MKTQGFPVILANISTVSMLIFVYLFVSRNAPGLVSLHTVTAIAVLYALLYLYAMSRLLQAMSADTATSSGALPARLILLLTPVVLVYIFLDATVTDYYQPLSLYNEAIGTLALWWVLLIALNMYGMFASGEIARRLALVCCVALLGVPVTAGLWWVNNPAPGEDVAADMAVFVGGKDGYDIYRIPGLVVIPAGSTLASGEVLQADRLLAFAEARRDGALDTGVIDLVLKYSDNGGASWSRQSVICRHQSGERRGKCGNPTPLFDQFSGKLILAYNLSGLQADGRQHSAHLATSLDGGSSWQKPRQLASDNFIFGPGKGIQKTRQPHTGRLLLPGYADGRAHVYWSDDQGKTWQRDQGLEGGDETDVAELSDGRLYLATRHIAPISRAPEPNGRLYSIGNIGSESWPPALLDQALPTPVCQVSVLQADDGGLLFSNPAHRQSRVQMTVRYSKDFGASWASSILVYPGPAGYSVLGRASNGDVYVLYENGNMAYSERISLARIAREKLIPHETQG